MQNGQRKQLQQAAERIHAREPAYKRAGNISFLIYILIVVIFAFAVRTFIFETARVDGHSMETTLFHDERLIVEKVSYWFSAPKRGDIIICFYPNDKTCVKRVIGLPGDKVEVRIDGVYINDEYSDESKYWSGPIVDTAPPVTVPENSVYVIGDNRNPYASNDSRNTLQVGCIPYHRILGRANLVCWPFDAIRGV